MEATKPPSASPFTWEATATVTPTVHVGPMEECKAWMDAMEGREVTVTDANGETHVIGIVTTVSAKALA